ncbi:NeuD/PglB/VioB family sugar acetyltransferase [Candidatus Pelagibacter ubique]|jgi:sugar O-acyltransferase (sialic acid O-acetyltransferase NeuD family)|nr:NeuD/PglB/VioB family sugar acetyltransferase [Candidatus Pelagibacter ubique]
MNKKIIIIGGGGHAKSINDIIHRNNLAKKIVGYVDKKKTNLNLNYLGNDSFLQNIKKTSNYVLVNGIGINSELREKLFDNLKKKFNFLTLIDNTAIISPFAKIKQGAVIFPLSYVGPSTLIDFNVVIHTKVSIEHDVKIEKNSYVGPGTTICGNCHIKNNTLIGGNSFIKQNIIIGKKNIVGAGSIVLKNFTKQNKKIYGNPAKERK